MKTFKFILATMVAFLSMAATASTGKTNCKGMNQSAQMQARARTVALDVLPQSRSTVGPQGSGKVTK